MPGIGPRGSSSNFNPKFDAYTSAIPNSSAIAFNPKTATGFDYSLNGANAAMKKLLAALQHSLQLVHDNNPKEALKVLQSYNVFAYFFKQYTNANPANGDTAPSSSPLNIPAPMNEETMRPPTGGIFRSLIGQNLFADMIHGLNFSDMDTSDWSIERQSNFMSVHLQGVLLNATQIMNLSQIFNNSPSNFKHHVDPPKIDPTKTFSNLWPKFTALFSEFSEVWTNYTDHISSGATLLKELHSLGNPSDPTSLYSVLKDMEPAYKKWASGTMHEGMIQEVHNAFNDLPTEGSHLVPENFTPIVKLVNVLSSINWGPTAGWRNSS